MVRNRINWRFLFLFAVLILNGFTKSLPIEKSLPALNVYDTSLPKLEIPKFGGHEVISESETKKNKFDVADNSRPSNETVLTEDDGSIDATETLLNQTRSILKQIRPGQEVDGYEVKITFDGDTFHGEVLIDVTPASREDSIVLHIEDLEVHEVLIDLNSVDNAESADFDINNGRLVIEPNNEGSSYVIIIKYSGEIRNLGHGIVQREFNDYQYIVMNLFPTNARRVFPCMDELQAATTISFMFEDVPFNSIVSNSRPEDDDPNHFRTLRVPPHLWGMVAHNFNEIAIPVQNVALYGRSGLNQHNLAGIAINAFFTSYQEKLNTDYFEINENQNGRINIFALPDTNVQWNALSTICIWEPYIFMTNTHSMMQQKTVLVTIAEAMARQWFGYVVYPEDWKDQWVISGLASHTAQAVVTDFQSSDNEDITLLDMNTIFTTDVIQEAFLLDSYRGAVPISPREDIDDEADIRHHTLGLLKFKAPAIMRMLRLVLGDEDEDYIFRVGQLLLSRRVVRPISFQDFISNLNTVWSENDHVENVGDFIEPWVHNTGYPILHVGWRSPNLVLLVQEHFRFTSRDPVAYRIPVTFTTNQQQNYDNVHPTMMHESTVEIPLPNTLDEDDYVIFNIQGQGYYRVNYDLEFWERIISALDDPDRRQEIHPLNRASLIDDALNLARGGKLNYEVALRVVLTWVHEMEYAPWKAFIRNMEFLRKALLFAVNDDDDLDSNIYLRMVRRTIETFEEEVSFTPDPSINEPAMTSLARGMVMDHACRSNHDPCVAAANDWFYDSNSDEPAVNPNIPVDIQPAVFCTMVREAGTEATDLLYDYLDTDISHYDRLVVLESLGCSHDEGFINELMRDTISEDSIFGIEERYLVMAAIIRSDIENVYRVIEFMEFNVNNVRDMYGGPQKLEELLLLLGENIVNEDSEFNFRVWVTSNGNNLDDSKEIAERALSNVQENLDWVHLHLDEVYEWIDENDAHTIVFSFSLLCFTVLISLFNV